MSRTFPSPNIPSNPPLRAFHLFCGGGGGALGFQRSRPQWRGIEGRWETVGGIDVDSDACAVFESLTGHRAHAWDLFARQGYEAFHGHPPPAFWREITPADLRRVFGEAPPDAVFFSAPCKGFSALLPKKAATQEKYQALNRLFFRGLWLVLQAWPQIPLLLMENVPRIRQRGAQLLRDARVLLRDHGYALTDRDHDAGELGGLAQSRKRFLLVARHRAVCPPHVYEPTTQPLKTIGEVLGALPLPGDATAGPCHRLSRLQWRTWIRLALIRAGADWRFLKRIGAYELRLGADGLYRMGAVVDGQWQAPIGWDEATPVARWEAEEGALDRAWLEGGRFETAYHVRTWQESTGTVSATGSGGASGGQFVGDPRVTPGASGHRHRGNLGIVVWEANLGAVTSRSAPSTGSFAVGDPRPSGQRHNTAYRVKPWKGIAGTITTADGGRSDGAFVTDPRIGGHHAQTKLALCIEPRQVPSGAPKMGPEARQGAPRKDEGDAEGGLSTRRVDVARPLSSASPQLGCSPRKGSYGVMDWASKAGTVAAACDVHAGRAAVADPRPPVDLSKAPPQPPIILSPWGLWHRPLTDLELMALQGFDPWAMSRAMAQMSSTTRRQIIGNAVPPPAAEAIADEFGATLLAARAGAGFELSAEAIWVERCEGADERRAALRK